MDRSILTIVVEVKDLEAAKPIWDAMKDKDSSFLGCRPFVLSWSNSYEDAEKYEAVANEAMERHAFDTDRDLPDELETECGKKFFQWPFQVYSTSEKQYDRGEWFTSLETLKEKYKVKE